MAERKQRRIDDEIVISALMSCPTRTAAAAACGISLKTLGKYLDSPDFMAKYDAARVDVMRQNVAKLQYYTSAAIDELAELSTDKTVNAQVRLKACVSLIHCCVTLTEQTELLQRIARLEEAAAYNE